MQFQQLKYFIEVAKCRSISAAARNLYISQPSLSQQIINLEKELGIALLIRHSRTVTLSDAGEQFLVHAEKIVGAATQLAELMQRHSFLLEGTLRIGMLWVAGYLNLFRVVSDYRVLHPGLKYDFRVDGSSALLDSLLKRDIHCAFVISSDEQQLSAKEDLYYQKIIADSYAAIVSVKNPLASKKSISLQDLDGVPLIMPSPHSTLRRLLERKFDECGAKPVKVCEISQSDIVLQMAAQDLGIGFSSVSIAKKLNVGKYAIVPLSDPIARDVFYVTLKELLGYPSISSFTDYLKDYPF